MSNKSRRKPNLNNQEKQSQEVRSIAGRPTDVTGQISSRAHELYDARGCAPGRALEDWLIAEDEIMHK
jgi:hypothetical protein